MPGFSNSVVYFEKGIDPRGTTPIANQMTTGTLLIGSSVSPYVITNTLTAGAGVNITNGDGSITIGSVGGGVTWSTVGASTPLLNNNGFFCTGGAALSFSLPAVSAVGDAIGLTLDGSASWTITQGAGQQIRFGALATTPGVGGSVSSASQGDTLIMVCSVANLKWNIISVIGNIALV
jgi:hypothetical protein